MHTYANNKKIADRDISDFFCDPDAIRTRDRLLRRQMLYPAELPDPFCDCKVTLFSTCKQIFSSLLPIFVLRVIFFTNFVVTINPNNV